MATLWAFKAVPVLESKGWRPATHAEVLSVCPDFDTEFMSCDPFVVDPFDGKVVTPQEAWKIQEDREKLSETT
jgi:hypothetical protein